ncbi:glycoside hydrolase family 13 protein [Lacinutrix sp. 5H-3-7-4]|uniref:glycoside hydrolase family 13 protein n=1 Tax=Lacinutrix sp. (strain 5H-3-7-4) TaxID=983544 RepID=UPI00020A3BC3|nr:glycoside hydrolase family 13 protein [Lacinutrix sp. 5H-3-7-4]AEH00520.1 alpha amylase catalytic region [Lacinutrix sp. 5H-3-7-4]
MKKLIPLALVILISVSFSCQKETEKIPTSEVVTEVKNDIERIEPPHWWIGFNNTQVQLLVKHPNISEATPSINYAGVSIEKVHKADSPNYLFLDLNISESAKAGQFNIHFKLNEEKELVQTYEVKARVKEASDYQGFDSTDAIYLITPDRFANGDTSNDINERLKEKTINREDDYARHGGDLRGIIQHLDYIEAMGFTQIWPCPLLTNDMSRSSYHGYAMTDFYQVDPRYGSLEEYQELATKAKEKGIGLIMDQVANHCGSEHWWMQDLPFKDWVNQQESFENNKPLNNSNHRRTSNQDLYASKRDKKEMAEGWFVPTMPDLNQRNPFMANYIIQNSIWWVETLKLSGIRQDTYPYPDKNFMSNWAGAIMNEYPNFSIVGEEWSTNPLLIAYWQEGHDNKDGYDSNLRSTMDFAMQKNTVDALNEAEKWDTGLVKIYEGLANDFAYASPKDIMVFPDNHDMSRIFTQLKGDVPNTKMALSYLLSLPRIPQLYYGTEILMNDFAKPGDHGLIRTDFPGGWQDDTVNAFSGEGLTDAQKDMQLFLKKVLNYRKSSDAIHHGKTIHFAPFMGTYFLFRVIEGETVVLIINKNEKPITIDLNRYSEIGLDGKPLNNIITGEVVGWNNELTLKERGVLLLTTKI